MASFLTSDVTSDSTNEDSNLILPPLSLYIHIPWCVRKCPYCDFNSHEAKERIPEKEYVQALLDDLETDLSWVQGREIHTIFIGGGTPSLLSVEAYKSLLSGLQEKVTFSKNIEITMEANPGTFEQEKFRHFRQAGINRLSIGIQSFQPNLLKTLGRIHNREEAIAAVDKSRLAGFDNINLDLMHGLPDQSVAMALEDLKLAIELNPEHLSWYQLTIEPNTEFYRRPPTLPEDNTLWNIQDEGLALLEQNSYSQYEISANAKAGRQAQHNLNYWRFGDYLGIGCGAHGKITDAGADQILRTVKVKHPKGYMDLSKPYLYQSQEVAREDRPFEFFMNRLRLLEPCPKQDYGRYTGLALSEFGLAGELASDIDAGLIDETPQSWQLTESGKRYLNSLLEKLV